MQRQRETQSKVLRLLTVIIFVNYIPWVGVQSYRQLLTLPLLEVS